MKRTGVLLLAFGLVIIGTIGTLGMGATRVQSAPAQADLTPTDDPLAATAQATADVPPDDFFGKVINVADTTVASGTGKIALNIHVPDGYKFNDTAPFKFHFYNNTNVAMVAPADNDLLIPNPPMPVSVPVTLLAGKATLTIDTSVYYCEAVNENLCFPLNIRFIVPLSVANVSDPSQAPSEIGIDYTLVPPQLPQNTLGGTPAR